MIAGEVTSPGTADRTKPPCCIFVLESHRGANQAKCWSRLSSCTLDLALVIGHALFDWDKVITCYLFRHCPSQSSACTDSNISPFCQQIPQILLILSYLKRKCIRIGSSLPLSVMKTNHFPISQGFLASSKRFRGSFSVLQHEF